MKLRTHNFQSAAVLTSLVIGVLSARAHWPDIQWVLNLPDPPPPKAAATKPAATAAATRNADDEIGAVLATTQPSTQAAAKPELKIPPGKPWTIRVMSKGVEVTMLLPDGWEKMEPTEKNPPVIYKQGKEDPLQPGKKFQRASWYFLVVESKRDKPGKVLDRAIVGRTTVNRDFEIREQKSFTMPDGTEAASLLYTARDAKGAMFASRETYRWVDDTHLLITFEWSLVSAWRECHNDMEAITSTIKMRTFAPVPETRPAATQPAAPASSPATAPTGLPAWQSK